MRKKRRYIAFESAGQAKASSVLQMVGFLRSISPRRERFMLKLVCYDARSRRGLLRCGHMQVDDVKTAMSAAVRNGAETVVFRVLGVSGTINAAKRKFLTIHQAKG